ncbi:MAG: ATP-dependent RNA helicase HrpA [Thermodesulfobacteriota bacterium]
MYTPEPPANPFAAVQSLLPRALHADRIAAKRQLKQLRRRSGKQAPDGKMQNKLAGLERRLQKSAAVKQKRIDGRPRPKYNPELPITEKRDQLVELIANHQVVIVSGETGSGKTTQLPKFCLEAGRGIEGRIACTQPRRIAAITVATRIAEELGEEPGHAVGHKIRFQDKVSEHSSVKMMTDGILLAETQGDKYLNEYDTIIVDEAHERSLNIDFLLGLLKQLVEKRRDLKLIITSATIDTEKFSKAFFDAPIVEVSGRMYPVEVRYMPPESFVRDTDDFSYVEAAVSGVDRVVREAPFGDVLVFMPTEADIRETCEMLSGRQYKAAVILPLYARLPAAEQSKVFAPAAGRKIIVATNVAETSITIPGIKYVVDTGLARISTYIPGTRTTALPVAPISKSSADQRKGRCGRVANGVCVRLFSEDDYESRPMYTPPEVLRANLAEVILRMIALKLGDVEKFPFVDPPPAKQIKDGFNILYELDAILSRNAGKKKSGKPDIRLTRRGELMAKMPLDPRISRMLIEARDHGVLPTVAVIAAALTISDPRERPEGKEAKADAAHAGFRDPASDFITLFNIWRGVAGDPKTAKPAVRARDLKAFVKSHWLSFKRMREWLDVYDQITTLLAESGITLESGMFEPKPVSNDKKSGFSNRYAAVHQSILSGFLANIAERKEKNLYRGARQKELMIFPGSGLFNRAGGWIVAAEIVETSRRFARMVANIDPAWLEPIGRSQCKYTYLNPRWRKNRETVIADEQVSLYGLIIVGRRPVPYGKIDPETASEIFIREALIEGDVKTVLPFMRHNWDVADEIRDMEERIRRRELLASEADMLEFYRQRLHGVYDMRTLKKKIRENGSDDFLKMQKADLMAAAPDEEELAQYPDQLPLGDGAFTCAYRFNPGAADDGVTLKLPASAAGAVPREATDWVVPGLLSEKIAALLKNLPKVYRKQLVPVSDTVAVIMREMPKYRGSLVATLSRFIYERFGVDIPVRTWSEAELPDHLQLRFALIDADGNEVVSGRDRRILNGSAGHSVDSTQLARERQKWEQTGLTRWEIPDLPEMISIAGKNGENFPVYPGLEADGEQVNLRLFTDRNRAEAAHRQGVARLFAVYFAKEVRFLRRAVALPATAKAKAVYFGGVAAVEAAIVDHVIEKLFARNIRTEAAFYEHAGNTVNHMIETGRAVLEKVIPVIDAYHEVRDRIYRQEQALGQSAVMSEFFSELRQSLDRVVPENFIRLYDTERMGHLVRYVKALAIRAERGVNDLEKDSSRARQAARMQGKLEELIATLDDAASAEKRAAVEEFFWMIEEFKVSLFAQELKTAYPVSEKRLNKRYAEIMRMG